MERDNRISRNVVRTAALKYGYVELLTSIAESPHVKPDPVIYLPDRSRTTSSADR